MRISLVLAALLAALLHAPPAHAGRAWAWAEDARLPNDSANCTREAVSQATRAYTVVRCTASGVTSKFHLRFQMPPDMPNNGPAAKFHIQTAAGVTGDCTWEVSLVALPALSSLSAAIPGGTYQSVAQTLAAAETRRVTAATSAIPIKNLNTGVTCTGSDCLQMDLVAIVRLNAKTASSCDFTVLELTY